MTESTTAIHPLLTLIDAQESMEKWTKTYMTMETKSSISKALDKIACPPFASFVLSTKARVPSCAFGTHEDNALFGTLGKPNVDKILDVALKNRSKFGRGEETVLDLNYRDGYEIEAKDIRGSEAYNGLQLLVPEHISTVMSHTLLAGKDVDVRLYKLAVYQKGGHFDWHRDTTHSDAHVATVLVSLNTQWKGGELCLRHRGEETVFGMQPLVKKSGYMELQAVAFYTDVEHKVEPVTDGTRIVLQYDVHLKPSVDAVDATVKDDEDSEDDAFEDEFDEDEEGQPIFEYLSYNGDSTWVDPLYKCELPSLTSNEGALERLVSCIRKHLQDGDKVGFPLRHLYRQRSILPEYLKGVDALIYDRLSSLNDIETTLYPIIMSGFTSDSGSWKDGEKYVSRVVLEDEDEERELGEHEEGTFHAYHGIDIREMSRQKYIEYTGNEAQMGFCRYFGGGMFLEAVEEGEGD